MQKQDLPMMARLDTWGVITVTGPEAASFLQNQLTNNVQSIAISQSGQIALAHVAHRFSGYCSAKGRLLASFWISRQKVTVTEQDGLVDQFSLFISADLAATISKKLSMYVLRSKVKVENQSHQQSIYGYLSADGEADADAIPNSIKTLPGISINELPQVQVDGQAISRHLIAIPKDLEVAMMTSLPLSENADKEWQELEVMSAIPRITEKTFEQFVPQMVNMESIQGVDFKKGCYPGQEIVARSQYRGTIKRRLQLAQVASEDTPQIGQELFHSADPEQPCGMVVLVGPSQKSKTYSLQVECKLDALESGSVHLGSLQGPRLKFFTLPYALIEI
jgi:folate-binding protein YgfZ